MTAVLIILACTGDVCAEHRIGAMPMMECVMGQDAIAEWAVRRMDETRQPVTVSRWRCETGERA